MVHDGRLVAGPGKFKFKCNLFKAVIHEALQNGLTGFCGSGGQLLGCRTESVGNVPQPTGQAASCRKPQDLDNTLRGKKHLDQRGEQKTWDCANSDGAGTAAPWVGDKDPSPVYIVHCESSS